jgi:hypothetical protein
MLAPEIKPIPKISKVNGRVQIVSAGEGAAHRLEGALHSIQGGVDDKTRGDSRRHYRSKRHHHRFLDWTLKPSDAHEPPSSQTSSYVPANGSTPTATGVAITSISFPGGPGEVKARGTPGVQTVSVDGVLSPPNGKPRGVVYVVGRPANGGPALQTDPDVVQSWYVSRPATVNSNGTWTASIELPENEHRGITYQAVIVP